MKITLKDGSCKEYASAMSIIDIAKDISEGLARVACAGEVDGKVEDLRTVIDKDCELNIITANDRSILEIPGLETVTCALVSSSGFWLSLVPYPSPYPGGKVFCVVPATGVVVVALST